MGNVSVSGVLCFLLVVLLCHSELYTVSAQAVRKKRSLLPEQPRIITQDGHLVFQSGTNHNITFKAGNGGGFLLNNVDLMAVVNQAQQTKANVDRISASFGSGTNNLTYRVSTLEGHVSTLRESNNQYQVLSGRMDTIVQAVNTNQAHHNMRLNSLETRFPVGASMSTINNRISNVTARVLALESSVRNLERTLQSMQTLLTTDDCVSNPCANGGTCRDGYNGYYCQCTPQWQGPECSQDVNECYDYQGTDLGCQNGGVCHNTPGSYSCECPANYYGIHCRETHNDCTGASQTELCGQGICHNVPRAAAGQPRFTCICDQGWTNTDSNPACVVDVNECEGYRHCSVDPPVQCFNFPGGFQCGHCPAGFTGNGHHCYDINECNTNNGGCSPVATCNNNRGSFTCGPCPSGYTGDGVICSFGGICAIDNGGCHPLATCNDNGNVRTGCICPLGYGGFGIGPNGCVPDEQAGPCSSNPCRNQGICTPGSFGAFYCTCTPGFQGPTCEQPTNACASNPCINGGTCSSRPGGQFVCTCTAGYTGDTCQQERDACGGLFTQETGSLRYPPTVNATYGNHLDCSWTITTSPDKVLRLEFHDFHLESHFLCEYDSLTISDGNSAASPSLGTFCGTQIDNIINSTGNSLYLWFTTDVSIGHDGFHASWTSHIPGCGGHLTGDSGNITSPGWPGVYANYLDCVWTVAVTPGNNIIFTFGHLALEHHSNCGYDYLEIRDGETETASRLGRFCSTVNPAPITTTGPFAYLHFHSDYSIGDTGFHITYQTSTTAGCGSALASNTGTVQTPNYPNTYTEAGQCVWTITTQTNTQIQLTFAALDLQSTSGCTSNYLEIRDGSDQTAPLLRTVCDSTEVAPVSASGNVLFLELYSDGTMTGSGFQATWNGGCGGTFIGSSGQIVSPGWPDNHPDHQDCVYTITVPELSTVVLNITQMHLEGSQDSHCFDYLEFFDGADTSADQIGSRLCGIHVARIIRSTGQSLTVTFHSDYSVQRDGFLALYQAEEASGDDQCGAVINPASSLSSISRASGTYTPPGTECVWHITEEANSTIRLNFQYFWFPAFSNGTCAGAGLTVEDMVPEGEGLVPSSFGTYCGRTIPTFVSTSNQMTLRMTARNNSAAQIFFASIGSLQAVGCGAALTDSTGVIRSPNYPNEYPHFINCVWTITVAQGRQIRLNVTDFQIEPHSSCTFDALEIRNGGYSTSPLQRTYCGDQLQFTPLISDSNKLFLRFYTDSSVAQSGFSINYDSAATGCGGVLTSPTGAFISPNYPEAYPHNVECIWTITVSQGSNIILSFLAFDVEDHYQCGFDFLEVREGSQQGSLVRRVCGSEIPDPIISTTNTLWIRYRTDYSVAENGFSAQYTANCNRNITGRSGVIESPNYPEAYPNHMDCTWIITAPPGNKINASFATLSLEYHPTCAFDSITVRDGASSTATVLQQVCHGNTLPDDVTTSGRALRIHFVSDHSIANGGFRLEWIVDGCGGDLVGSSGNFSSPGYPTNYAHSLLCEWTIQVPAGKRVQLTITDFRVEFQQNCNFDALDIYAGPDDTGPRISRLCGDHWPQNGQTITASGNRMFVRFSADSSASSRGFSIHYAAIDEGCGGTFSAVSATIFSPNYPGNYGNNMECEYLIQVASGHTVELTFNTFHVEGNNYDHVTLYDGTTVSAPTITYLMGHNLPNPRSYRSSNNSMLVRFFSDSSENFPGFNATYRTACGGTLNADVDGSIRSPQRSALMLSCVWHIVSQIPTRRVSLTFTHFNMRGNCENNYVSLADSLDPAVTESSEVQQSYCRTGLPPMYTSRGSALTVVMNVTSFTNGDFRAVYTSSGSACGGNFSAPAGRFNSPGYPDQYPSNTECVWQITMAPGNSLMLSFPEFQLDPDGEMYDDYVEIYAPDLNGELQGRYYAGLTPANLTQMSGVWIKFKSDDDGTGAGFRAQWNYADFNALTGDQGQIGSPGLNYLRSVDLRWTITVDEGKRIRITFNRFMVEESNGCSYDYLRIYDGAESDGVTLGQARYCGERLPEPVESVNNVVSLYFHSDSLIQLPGFLLTWQAVVHDPSASTNGSMASGCGSYLPATEMAQNFTSPNFPNNYPASTECQWVITVTEGHRIELTFLSFELESHGSCVYDYLKIYDGNVNGPVLGTFCGRNLPPKLTSNSSSLVVKFTSDFIVTKPGFNILYKQACGGRRTDPVGIISSQGYPGSYPDGLNCLYNVRVPLDRTIQVVFNSPFNIVQSASGNCSDDYLQLFNGMDVTGPPLILSGPGHPNGRYCGSSVPSGGAETSGHVLTAVFISDNSSSAAGFSFNYTEKHYACGGQIRLTNAVPSGYIMSPNYPSNYPQNVDCKWVLIAPATKRVQLDFEGDFYIETSANNDCVYDYIEFHDGGTLNSPRVGERACGQQLPSSVSSTGNHLLVRFRTDNSSTHAGFKAGYSIATCGGRVVIGTQPYVLTSPNYPGNYGPNLDCFWVLQGPVGHFLTINLTDVRLQSSSDCTSADILEILDPATATLSDSITQENPETSAAVQGLSVAQARANASGSVLFSDCGNPFILAPITTADNRAYIWFRSDASGNFPGFRLQTAASVEECGGAMTTTSGVISSPNFPYTYPHSRLCRWKIKVPVGRKIKLTFTHFGLERGSFRGRCRYDFVQVTNGILRISPRLGRYCGTQLPAPVSSSANTMKVVFRADSSITHGGFRAEYTSDEDADCGGLVTESPGVLTSPNFTGYGSSHEHRVQCIWQVENRQVNGSIKFRFTNLDLEYHSGCLFDFVMVKEGAGYRSPLVGRFCGNSTTNFRQFRSFWRGPPRFVIPTANAWVAFVSDSSIAGSGFRVEYTFESCGGVLTDPTGEITSPGYPGNYATNVDCAWLITAPEGMVIKVNVTDFDFERHSRCYFDFLVIQNGGLYDSPVIGKYCHNDSIPFITSQSNELRMVMSTDGSIAGRGFRLQYAFSHPGCGGHLSDLQGSLSSPDFPSSYFNNLQCVWDINVEEGYFVSLTIRAPFDVACNDFVHVYSVDGDGVFYLLGTYCGNQVPPTLNSTTPRMRVVFQSNGDNVNGHGFRADYTAGCGGVITADTATLVSPGYPGYENNMHCSYFINPGGDKILSIYFQDFQLEHHPGCNHDYLRIYQGNSTSGERLANLCQDTRPAKVVGRGSLFLDFKTDFSRTYRGYTAGYRAEACGGTFTRDYGTFRTPAYPSNYLDDINCIFNFTVDEQKVVVLRIRNFDLQDSPNCNQDYLAIYDGSAIQGQPDRKLCGPLDKIQRIFKSSGNRVMMNFVTNSAINDKGFYGNYYATYGPLSGCGGTLEQSTGTIQSLDIDGNGRYEHNLDCDWNIIVDAGKNVVFNVTSMNLEGYLPNCPWDYIEVFDGPTIQSPSILKTCAQATQPIVVRTSTNIVLFRFHTDSSVARPGFNVTFYQEDRLCGGLLNATTQAQNLTSVGYPSPADQPLRCQWTLDSGRNDEQVKISVEDLQLGSNCATENLVIMDKPRGVHGMQNRLCGMLSPTSPHTFYTRRRQGTVVYHQESTTSPGFRIIYQRAGCDRVYTTAAGRITTPNYPNAYDHHLNCFVQVFAPNNTFLSFYFQEFHLETGGATCYFDKLVVAGGNVTSPPLCGNTLPASIHLFSPNATVTLTTDYSVSYLGYAITYVASTAGPGCGGNLSHAIPGYITSPQFPSSPDGPLDCTWHIQSPSLLLIKLTALGGPGTSGYCTDTYVELRNSRYGLGRYCRPGERVVRSNGLSIKYVVPAGNITAPTFKLSFSYLDGY